MSRRGENIWHRKDGRWEARYIKGYDGSRAVYGYLYAKSYAEAKTKQLAAKQNHTEVNTAKAKGSFEEIADAFLHRKKHHVKESTMSNYRYRIVKIYHAILEESRYAKAEQNYRRQIYRPSVFRLRACNKNSERYRDIA